MSKAGIWNEPEVVALGGLAASLHDRDGKLLATVIKNAEGGDIKYAVHIGDTVNDSTLQMFRSSIPDAKKAVEAWLK